MSDRFVQGSPVGSSPSFLTYENPDYNVRIVVPDNWTAQENNLESPYIVRIIPNDFLAEKYKSCRDLYIGRFATSR